ncbi:MAG: type II secretion system protein GspJ [Verrucomicrobiales bacterium]|nr:type II secretion system protein GspJ [Verrucomicrobiales bacterium]
MKTATRQSCRPTHRAAGFTLIEILIATLAFAVLLAALNSVLFSALRLRREAVQRSDDLDTRRQVRQLIEKDLRNAILTGGLLASNVVGTTGSEGAGRADRLDFYTTTGRVSDQEPWCEIQRVSYYLESGASVSYTTNAIGSTLVRAVSRNLLSEDTDEDTDYTPLLRDVESFELSFYDGSSWADSWDSTLMDDTAPTAVHLLVTFVDDPWREWRIPPIEILAPWTVVPRTTTDESTETGEAGGDDQGDGGGDNTQPPGGGGGGNQPPGGGGGAG